MVVLPVVLLSVAALGYSLLRTPVYTATTELSVGRTDVRTQAIPGFVEGAKVLAATYSEAAKGEQLQTAIARQAKIPRLEVGQRVTATAVPDSPTFKLSATGDDAGAAVSLAGIATGEMRRFADESNQSQVEADTLLRRYRATSTEATDLRTRIARLRRQEGVATGGARDAVRARIDKLSVEAEIAQLQVQTLGTLYSEARQNQQGAIRLGVVNPATTASSDRWRVFSGLLFAAVVAGTILGIGLALVTASQRRRR